MYGKMYTNLLAWGIKVMNDMYKEDIEARWQLLVWRTVIAICGVTFALSWILYGVHRVEKNIGSGLYMLEYICYRFGCARNSTATVESGTIFQRTRRLYLCYVSE